MGRTRHRFFAYTLHFLELFHEGTFGVKTSCGINDNDIDISRPGCLYCIKYNSRWIRTALVFDKLRIASFCPDLKLLYGSSPEGVGCCEQYRVSLVSESACQLSDSSCFPDTIDAYCQYYKGFFP